MSKPFLLRLSPDIHKRLAARAKEEGVSLNSLILCELAKASVEKVDTADSIKNLEGKNL